MDEFLKIQFKYLNSKYWMVVPNFRFWQINDFKFEIKSEIRIYHLISLFIVFFLFEFLQNLIVFVFDCTKNILYFM